MSQSKGLIRKLSRDDLRKALDNRMGLLLGPGMAYGEGVFASLSKQIVGASDDVAVSSNYLAPQTRPSSTAAILKRSGEQR